MQRPWITRVAWIVALAPMTALAASSPAGHASVFSWSRFLGPFHMVMLHFPIGFLALAAVLEVWAIWKPFEGIRKLIGLTLILSSAAAAVTVVLGLLRARTGDYASDTLAIHRATGIGVACLSAVTWLLHRGVLSVSVSRLWTFFYRSALAATVGCLTVAGHQGGTLTHGKGFLSENSPAVIRTLLDEEPNPAPKEFPTGNKPSLALDVHQIFQRRCETCHGPEKQKSKFRVDVRETLLKGGQSGEAAITPGDPFHSNLIRLVMLPRGNDDAMPPEGKEALTQQELMTVIQWIQAGAPDWAAPAAAAASSPAH